MSAAASLPAALALAEEYGLPVFPCRSHDEMVNGEKRNAKSPLTPHGFEDASTSIARIDDWFTKTPDALVAVPTGTASNLFVVDVDPAGADWYQENAVRLACGRVHKTRRGWHLVYRMPAVPLGNTTSHLAHGVDTRGAGGYVIWWPAHGFETTGGLEDLSEPPAWLVEALHAPAKRTDKSNGTTATAAAGLIAEGGRNAFLSAEAFRQRKQGGTVDQILIALLALNATRCVPPLAEAEVRQIAAGKARVDPEQQSDSEWTPPAVATYGASFDASQIPLRRWLLGHRRSVGEVTLDAGPPGVNKSTLMLTDAVAIATGRKILADEVHESGHVLLLAGEDARRDIEARIAGILAYYRIAPAELADRLHVVYLAEIDPAVYTLADMQADMATLNTRMLGWLRQYPDLVAIFVDPLVAWHRLIENSNEALQLLCAAMRAVAVQGKRHVGVDHHVTKVAMSDPEAHVGNIAAVRGAGALTAYTRWAFTLARLKEETAENLGVPAEARKQYRRLDSLKASYGPDDDRVRLLRVESVLIANGESVGVLVEVDTEHTREQAAERKTTDEADLRRRRTDALTRMLTEKRPRSAQQAALWLISHRPELFPGRHGEPLSDETLRKRALPALIGAGLDTTLAGQPARIVMREPEREGRGYQIDLEQTGLPL
jgi:AAA domain/Bifunctional DNA primase/polymerase, N-terminal